MDKLAKTRHKTIPVTSPSLFPQVINFVMALLKARDADLCKMDAKRRPSFFFNTWFLTKFKEEGVRTLFSRTLCPF
jgi:hypothetical protein